MATNVATGTLTADGTEQTLSDITDANGAYALRLNTDNMGAGDKIVVRVYTKIADGDSYALEDEFTLANEQILKNKLSLSYPVTDDIKFTLEQSAGTNRTYKWVINKL